MEKYLLKKSDDLNKKGISLIVLVITIIVIVILAVAVILSIANNNPIENAKEATRVNNESVAEEQARNVAIDYLLKEHLDPNYTSMSLSEKNEELKQLLINSGISEDIAKRTRILSDGQIRTLPEVCPTIPDNFEYLDGTIETGFVIRNINDGNEFVWVPVSSESDYARYNWPKNESYNTSLNESYVDEEGTNQKDDIVSNGGFYIGRYEASKSTDLIYTFSGGIEVYKPMSVASSTPYTNIRGDNYGAIYAGSHVYEKTDDSEYYSTLVTGYMWDITMKWLLEHSDKTDIKYYTSFYSSGISSKMIGNYNGNSTIPTGSNENYKVNNIYDLAGNAYEWTTEVNTSATKQVLARGGAYNRIDFMANRYSRRWDAAGGEVGFRFAVVLKSN